MENNIKIVFLQPNCSHASLSLEVAVFKPLKLNWKILKRFARESRLTNVDKRTFPGLLKQLCLKVNAAHAISGFCNAGIVPLEQKMKHRVTLVSSASGNKDDSKDRDDNPPTLQEG